MPSGFDIQQQLPQVDEFVALRAKVGWGNLDLTLAQQSLSQSLYSLVVKEQGELIAMARVVGDGALYFYIQDFVVDPNYQGMGIGKQLMQTLDVYFARHALRGATIGLFAAKGKESFYQNFGYQSRDGNTLGLGMCRFIKHE